MSAFESEAGITLICPTTGIAYTPEWVRVELLDGQRFIQSRCRVCDAKGYTRADREFNPSLPQIHTHVIDRPEAE